MFSSILKNKKILITGHTGFKGAWLSIFLKYLGADVIGYALEPKTNQDIFVVTGLQNKITHIIGDIRDYDGLKNVFDQYSPEIIFHLAAQPIVRESYLNPKETYDVNIGGTVNVFECCRLSDSVKVIINITSDKCYENKEDGRAYQENDSFGGYDPYSSSKGCSELITSAYRNSFFNPNNFFAHQKSLSSVRAGNVIGGGDWQKDRIIPDCMRALIAGEPINVRNPIAIRPWQHVLECIYGYVLLASRMIEKPEKFCGGWNFGSSQDCVATVGEIVDLIVEKWGSGQRCDMISNNAPHEARLLSLDSSKARTLLDWKSVWNIEKTIEKTVEWYKIYSHGNPFELCEKQIKDYLSDLDI